MKKIEYTLPPAEERAVLLHCIEQSETGGELSAESHRAHYDCAVTLFSHHAGSEWVDAVSDAIDKDVSSWLLDLTYSLHGAGLTEEAADHAQRWATVEERANYLGDRAVILGDAGKAEAVKEQIAQLQSEFAEDAWVQIKCGDALLALADAIGAEERYLNAVPLTLSRYDREGILERLVPFLRERGRDEEASLWEQCIHEHISLLLRIRENWHLSETDIRAVMERKDFFLPYLRGSLSRRARSGDFDRENTDNTDIHAILFLMEWEDASLIPLMLSCLSKDDETLNDLYGDTLTTLFWLPVARAGHRHLELIRMFVTDESKNLYARMSVVDGVIALPHFHPDQRQEVISFVEQMVKEPRAFTEDVLAGFLCDCADSGLTELAALSAAFAGSMPDYKDTVGMMAHADDLRKALREGKRAGFISDRPTTIVTVNADWKEWAERTAHDHDVEFPDIERDTGSDILHQIVDPPLKKIGRNELCPCGSGKKYKKCHGAE